jgi:hypothetical protein
VLFVALVLQVYQEVQTMRRFLILCLTVPLVVIGETAIAGVQQATPVSTDNDKVAQTGASQKADGETVGT